MTSEKEYETVNVRPDGRVVLKRAQTAGLSTPVIDSAGKIFPSQLAAAKHYAVDSGRVNECVRQQKDLNGVTFRYATYDEVLDWLTNPSVGSKSSQPSNGRELSTALLRKELEEARKRIDELTQEKRQRSPLVGGFLFDGFEFPGGPAVVRIRGLDDWAMVRKTRADVPQEIQSLCKWHNWPR